MSRSTGACSPTSGSTGWSACVTGCWRWARSSPPRPRPSIGASPTPRSARPTTTPAIRCFSGRLPSWKPASGFCSPCSPIEQPRPDTQGEAMTEPNEMVNVRYMVADVDEAIAFYSKFLDFKVLNSFEPAFADVARGNLRLLLSGPASSAGRPMPDGTKPGPGGWNRIHLIVDDIEADLARLRDAGAQFRNDILEGPGGKQILLQDPSGNVVELFQPADRNST